MAEGQQNSKVKKDKTTSRWSYKSLFGRDSSKGVWGCMTSCRYSYDSTSSIDAIKQFSSGDGGTAPRLQLNLAAESDKPKPKPLTHWSQETGGQERANNSSASLNTLSSYGTCYSQDPGEKYRKRYVEFCHQQTGGTQQEWWNEYYGENNDFWAKKQRDGEQY